MKTLVSQLSQEARASLSDWLAAAPVQIRDALGTIGANSPAVPIEKVLRVAERSSGAQALGLYGLAKITLTMQAQITVDASGEPMFRRQRFLSLERELLQIDGIGIAQAKNLMNLVFSSVYHGEPMSDIIASPELVARLTGVTSINNVRARHQQHAGSMPKDWIKLKGLPTRDQLRAFYVWWLENGGADTASFRERIKPILEDESNKLLLNNFVDSVLLEE